MVAAPAPTTGADNRRRQPAPTTGADNRRRQPAPTVISEPRRRLPHPTPSINVSTHRVPRLATRACEPDTPAHVPSAPGTPRSRRVHSTPTGTHRVPRLATRACEPDTPAHVPSAPGTPRSRRVHSTPTGAHAAFTFRAGAFLLRWGCLRLFRRTQTTPLSWRQHRRRHRRRPYIPVAPRLTTQHSHPLLRRFPWK